jgi:hypothetical protein
MHLEDRRHAQALCPLGGTLYHHGSHQPVYISTLVVSYGPPWAHYLCVYQDRLLGGPLGLPGLCHTTPDGVRRKDYGGEVLR